MCHIGDAPFAEAKERLFHTNQYLKNGKRAPSDSSLQLFQTVRLLPSQHAEDGVRNQKEDDEQHKQDCAVRDRRPDSGLERRMRKL